jgi:hypothetical protein
VRGADPTAAFELKFAPGQAAPAGAGGPFVRQPRRGPEPCPGQSSKTVGPNSANGPGASESAWGFGGPPTHHLKVHTSAGVPVWAQPRRESSPAHPGQPPLRGPLWAGTVLGSCSATFSDGPWNMVYREVDTSIGQTLQLGRIHWQPEEWAKCEEGVNQSDEGSNVVHSGYNLKFQYYFRTNYILVRSC